MKSEKSNSTAKITKNFLRNLIARPLCSLRSLRLNKIGLLLFCGDVVCSAATVENLTFNGQADSNQASFVLHGKIKPQSSEEPEAKLIYTVQSETKTQLEPKIITQTCELKTKIFQGKLKELPLALWGAGEVKQVTGEYLRDWSIRVIAPDNRFLVLRPVDLGSNAPPLTNFSVTITTSHVIKKLPLNTQPLTFIPENAMSYGGSIELKVNDSLELDVTQSTGLAPLRLTTTPSANTELLQFRFGNESYTLLLDLREKDADARKIDFEKFQLTGELKDDFASFVLTGEAVVKHPDGGSIAVLSGDAALTQSPANAEVKFEQGRYWLHFRKPGRFPIELQFHAKVAARDGWNALNFEVVSSPLRPLTLKNLPDDTQFQFPGSAKPERFGDSFVGYLPATGKMALEWKQSGSKELGKLFYSVEGTGRISVGSGLLRQAHVMDFKVMQGELSQLVFDLTGEGEISRLTGDGILNWKTDPSTNGQRKLTVQLNQGHKDRYTLFIQTQTPLGQFPSKIEPLRIIPSEAIRFGGHLLVVNDGAVRLEVTEARGLSQISPELFPRQKEFSELATPSSQTFAYRFSDGNYVLNAQADHILPELSVSELLLYRLGETETAIDAEMELDIREAPLREFIVRIPADFTVSRLNIAQLSDYSLLPDTAETVKCKILFSQPLTGRQVLQLRLEKNQNAIVGTWNLPVLTPLNVKSVRGYVGIVAETGFRITANKIIGLAEIANAYFPRKVSGLQAAYRLREEFWSASMTIERLTLSVQADTTHLFTINEGIAYGSSVLNYLIAGTPVSTLKVSVPSEYNKVEFAGRDVRNWKKVGSSYEVYLHTPAFGSYTLLATYDRQFNAQSNTVSFVGVRPLDAQTEQGSVFVVSEQQVQVKPVQVSSGLLQLEPGEILPEHRLLFDAPILVAYQYTARPFEIQLALNSLALGETVHQVVDRSSLTTRVSREGEVVTTARYFLKSQGHSHLRLTIPKDAQLWEAKVNDTKVVPVADKGDTLVPLPPNSDSGTILIVDLKLAMKSTDKAHIRLDTPAIAAPVLLTEWNLTPDEKYKLEFRQGNVTPNQRESRSGFAELLSIAHSYDPAERNLLFATPILLLLGIVFTRWATRDGVFRGNASYVTGTLLGALACLATLGCLIALIKISSDNSAPDFSSLSIVAPIQEAGKSLAIQVNNLETGFSETSALQWWPAFISIALWLYAVLKVEPRGTRSLIGLVSWAVLAWAALRVPNGAPFFFVIAILFVICRVILPSGKSLVSVPPKPDEPTSTTPPAVGPATALILFSLVLSIGLHAAPFTSKRSDTEPSENTRVTRRAIDSKSSDSAESPRPENIVHSIIQKARVVENIATIQAILIWQTDAGQKLDFLNAPAVLTKIDFPKTALNLTEAKNGNQIAQRLIAKETGRFEIHFEYQIAIQKEGGDNSITLPTPLAPVNQLSLEIEKADVDVFSTHAASIQISRSKQGDSDRTQAELMLVPTTKSMVGWRPRSRDVRSEKTVFYSELTHLFVPTAGIVEGVHHAQIRLAQGQLGEISSVIPPHLTITDVQASFVSSWRFDPDQRILRVQFNAVQTKPFGLRLRSQLATTPLPYQQTVGVISISGSAGEVGMVGIATGTEVQLDSIQEEKFSTINLEDFPAVLLRDLNEQMPALTLRRAFRYSSADAKIILSASAVQPDVRVETQETLSLGEDRTVLASQWLVHITRAGIFKLSFALPRDFEIESLSGPALSHWTELKMDDARIITLHLKGKTEGDQQFSISLTGPGIGNRTEWTAPRLTLREGSKQSGQLVIVPELGVRLHAKNPDGVSQLDPRKSGTVQKGALAFRLLKPAWQLAFDIETVEPWIQVSSLQDVTVREGQMLVNAQLDYQIENAGVKSLSLQLPGNAENVRFEGDLVSDFTHGTERAKTNALVNYEVKLQRRVIGAYSLRLTYQISVTNQSVDLHIVGIKARTANLQHGYLAVRAGGRLQIQSPQLPNGLQRTEWQSIPAPLRQGRNLPESKDTFSTLDADFDLPIVLSRHEVTKVLPARVEKIDLTSVIAASGEMLTEGRLEMRAGDKRSLRLKLPANGQFWYAFVNGESASPWREGDQIVLLLEKNSDPNKPTSVEFFYTCQTSSRNGSFDHQLLGPSFDLPLENITWQVYVPENWKVKDWESSLQLRSETLAVLPATVNVESYLQTENARLQEKSKEAENLLNMGNDFLQRGTPKQARRAYEAAWRLSPQDAAFNEDARVQLHNLKTQQALLGLNQRRQSAFYSFEKRDDKNIQTPFTNWERGQTPDYTQQQAQQALEQNPAEDNATLMRLAERLVRQQDAGVATPESIRAALPAQGKQFTFTGSLQVKEWADLQVKLDTKTVGSRSILFQLGAVVILFAGLALLSGLTRKPAYA